MQQQQPPRRAKAAAVVWDLDGTLLDTETLSTAAIQMVLDEVGGGQQQQQQQYRIEWELKRRLLGLPGDVWGQMVVDELGLHGLITGPDLVSKWEVHLSSLSGSVEKMPGALAAVSRCQAAGVRQAIATSSSRAGVAKKSALHADLFAHMSLVVTGDDEAIRAGKPEPDIYLLAAQRLQVDARECVAVEDSLAGVLSALRAGMFCVAVPDPRLSTDKFEEAIAAHEGRGVILEKLDADVLHALLRLD